MISKEHTKLRYEEGFWEDLDPFYDFDRDNVLFTRSENNTGTTGTMEDRDTDDGDNGEEDGWEDMSEGDDVEMDVADDGRSDEELYAAYETEIARFGLNVTPLGELVFPDGRIIGHRALRKYYNQRARPEASGTAIVAAKRAAGERLYEGRVINIGDPFTNGQMQGSGGGVLVPLKDGAKGFSALSLYRFRAAVYKQRRDDDKGRRLKQRTTRNINRMDKKANRLMNGVSVAHAKR
jgi:pre-60S factor REI1